MDLTVQALLTEREGYVRRKRFDRVAMIDAELSKYGISVENETASIEPKVEVATIKRGRKKSV